MAAAITEQKFVAKTSWYIVAALTAALMAMVTIATKAGVTRIGKDWFLVMMFCWSLPFLVPYRQFGKPSLINAPRHSVFIFVCHAFCIASAWLLFSGALLHLPASVAVFVSRIEGVFLIALAGFFLKESLGPPLVIAAVIGFIGIALIDRASQVAVELNVGSVTRGGILMVLASALFFAGGEIFARKAMQSWSPRSFTLVRNMLLIPIFLSAALLSQESFFWDTKAAFWALVAALCGPVGARVLYLHCIRHIPVSHAAVMTNTEPVFGFILAFFVFSELPTAGQFVGAALVAGAILVTGSLRDRSVIAIASDEVVTKSV